MADPQNPEGTPTSSSSSLGPSAKVGYGIPATSTGAQFMLEEQAAAAARGQTASSLWAGFSLPPSEAGDFWQVYSWAETFAANTGWKYLPTPQLLVDLVKSGNIDNPQAAYQWFSDVMKVNQTTMPWAALGMSSTQYNQSEANLSDSLYALTGTTDFNAAGLGSVKADALFNNWSETHLQNYIQQNPALNAKYGYLALGQNYQQFQTWKSQNAATLQQRYGHAYTDQQAIQELGSPLSTFHAEGGTFGESVPYVAATSSMPTGRQSSVR
jgi:hypothetical protein